MTAAQSDAAALGVLLHVERAAREAASLFDLQHVAANETRKVNRARQIFVVELSRKPKVKAATGVGSIDGASMLAGAVADLVQRLGSEASLDKPVDFRLPAFTAPRSELASSYPYRDLLWAPLCDRDGRAFAGLLLARDTPWTEAETTITLRLAATYAHAWRALTARRAVRTLPMRPAVLIGGGAVLAGLVLLLPVPMMALAPAEVVAAAPVVVAAPTDGAIESIEVDSGQTVEANAPLVRLVDTTLRNKVEIAQREVEVAEARAKQASILAMTDVRGRHELGLAESELELKRAEFAYAADLLSRTVIKASRAGIAIYGDRKALVGRPVVTGERIMELADPSRVEIKIDVAAADAAALTPDGRIKLFLDVDPLTPRSGGIVRSDYKARPGESDVISFRTYATIDDGAAPPRIGLRGTAQIYGAETRLGVYLFRRPLASLRQYLGL